MTLTGVQRERERERDQSENLSIADWRSGEGAPEDLTTYNFVSSAYKLHLTEEDFIKEGQSAV